MAPKSVRRKHPKSTKVELSDSDIEMISFTSSASETKARTPTKLSSPTRPKPAKRQQKLDFSSRRSVASSSSPVKSRRAESSGTDASSDVNEVKFKDPISASDIRRKTVFIESDEDEVKEENNIEEQKVKVKEEMKAEEAEVIDLESDEEKVVAKSKRDTKKVASPTSDSDEDELPFRGGRRRVVRRAAAEVESEEEDVKPSAKRLGKRTAVAASLTPTPEDSGHDKKKGARLVKRTKQEPEPEEEESEEDILDGLDKHMVLDSRLRSAPTRNTKKMELRENLARLKRRKMGQDTPSPRGSTPQSSGKSESDDKPTQEVIRPRGRRIFKPIPGARPSQPTLQDWFSTSGSERDTGALIPAARQDNQSSSDGNDSSDQDSWIEDDGGEANVPVLPEEYSMLGHQSLAHHFKVVMQMFVHLACIKPRKRFAFRRDERNDQYFGISLRALKRKMDGMRDSLVTSSMWTSAFKNALNSHPELTIFDLDFAVPGCGACRISSRMSTFRGALSGDDYDRDTFEPVVKNEESAGSEEDEDEPTTTFDLGRYCQARVRCYHNFVHWEWQLFEGINTEIEVLRTAGLRNDPAQQRPAANDPDGIMGWLDRRGIVEQEWHRLEQLMEVARGLEFKKRAEDD